MASERARKLRSNPTDAEIRIWSRLRRRQLEGFRFRRQQPIGPFIIDFFCPEARLVIEVDGGQHADNATRDAVRTRWLEKAGCRVVRFWNHNVLANTDGVLEVIRGLLRS
jgi:very-short-patch-repair endonuclease